MRASRNGGDSSVEAGGANSAIKVMVVDDSRTIRRTAETLLEREGFTVITADDGFEALSRMVESEPDIVFLDIMMPRLDGYQTCSVIKSNGRFRATPVIMLSSKDGIFDKARGKLAGSEQFITKPFTREDLLEAIQQHVHVSK
ncbi:PleD family two-component system response regulator [Plasticicumulans sp.]|uniref:response regulator n=1 Tax=Plasticicumulans sp. TaxID=2307179 RepID=UPI000FB57199|nr:response regulator [Plasticicumulans sp.]MBS0601729.1 response regulator [Pseudomonadota bacterium]RTL03667.1 MAG: response regulator [Xanthomonadales bacterium]HMV39876.1 response regulator [Plasticicumulans sp.]HMW28857.1 response regulator [Plasticicumulans sp.]HMW43397.1 response regulator [Plasticicumulans sp.]